MGKTINAFMGFADGVIQQYKKYVLELIESNTIESDIDKIFKEPYGCNFTAFLIYTSLALNDTYDNFINKQVNRIRYDSNTTLDPNNVYLCRVMLYDPGYYAKDEFIHSFVVLPYKQNYYLIQSWVSNKFTVSAIKLNKKATKQQLDSFILDTIDCKPCNTLFNNNVVPYPILFYIKSPIINFPLYKAIIKHVNYN